MDQINVLITKPFPEHMLENLIGISPRISILQHEAKQVDDLPDDISAVNVLYTLNTLPDPEAAPALQWVQLHHAGADDLVTHPLYLESDVVFTTTSGIHAVSVAEYVMAQILAFAHRLPQMFEDKQSHQWSTSRRERYTPQELRGATLGIVGYGNIGREVARVANGLGMTVLAMKNNLRSLDHESYTIDGTGDPEAEIPERIYPPNAINSFVGECDYVVLTVPLIEATHHLVDGVVLSHMKPNAVLINVSRGDVVEQDALVDALDRGLIAGAALDVFREEPLPEDCPLWDMPNVIISPHIAGFSPHYNQRAMDLFAENLRRFVNGKPLLNTVDRKRGY
nr:D-2-hydroxyacid dehydrogenase [Anaerolineae bacterium]